jgi:hypothetical protein
LAKEETKTEEPKDNKKEEIYTSEELDEIKEWDVTLMDGLEDQPATEERDEDHELDVVLNDMVESLEETNESAETEELVKDPSEYVGGYYGDVLIDGNGPGIQVEESQILPVNSNTPVTKNTGIIDNSGSVHLNPTRL